jgi:ribokinase
MTPSPSSLPAKVAVVGHTEWAEFVQVEQVPEPGDIVHASSCLQLAAGGGAVAAVQMRRLNGQCIFVTALGSDQVGERTRAGLEAMDLEVEAISRIADQRRAFVFLDNTGERTITTIGKRLGPKADDALPWEKFDEVDAVYFTAGDAGALQQSRRARNLVATVRATRALSDAGVELDVLVASLNDKGEQYTRGDIEPVPRWVVRTDGSRGGTLESADGEVHDWSSVPVPGPRGDNYGAGDSFAGGLTCGLSLGLPIKRAITLGAYCGAAAVRGQGPYGAQASAEDLADWQRLYPEPG